MIDPWTLDEEFFDEFNFDADIVETNAGEDVIEKLNRLVQERKEKTNE